MKVNGLSSDNTYTNKSFDLTLSGVLPTLYGGTGLSTIGSDGQFLKSNGSSLAWASFAAPFAYVDSKLSLKLKKTLSITGAQVNKIFVNNDGELDLNLSDILYPGYGIRKVPLLEFFFDIGLDLTGLGGVPDVTILALDIDTNVLAFSGNKLSLKFLGQSRIPFYDSLTLSTDSTFLFNSANNEMTVDRVLLSDTVDRNSDNRRAATKAYVDNLNTYASNTALTYDQATGDSTREWSIKMNPKYIGIDSDDKLITLITGEEGKSISVTTDNKILLSYDTDHFGERVGGAKPGALYSKLTPEAGSPLAITPAFVLEFKRNTNHFTIVDGVLNSGLITKTGSCLVLDANYDLDIAFNVKQFSIVDEKLTSSLKGKTGNCVLVDTEHDISVDVNTTYLAITANQITFAATIVTKVNKIDTLETELNTTKGKVTTLEGKVTTVEGNITTLQGKVTAAEGTITTHSSTLTTHTAQITALQGQIGGAIGAGVGGGILGAVGGIAGGVIGATGSAASGLGSAALAGIAGLGGALLGLGVAIALDGNETDGYSYEIIPGPLLVKGTTSGVISITPQPDSGTYNFNLPITVGSAGQYLTSQGNDLAMTWTTPSVGVTSVTVSVPSFMAVTGSPITSSGTIEITASSTGSGTIVLNTSPTLVTPILGVASGTSLQLSSLTASSSIQTDSSKNLITISNSGSGLNILQTSPTLVTPILGVASGTSLQLSSLTASSSVQTDSSSNLITIANSGSGLNILQTTPTLATPSISSNLVTLNPDPENLIIKNIGLYAIENKSIVSHIFGNNTAVDANYGIISTYYDFSGSENNNFKFGNSVSGLTFFGDGRWSLEAQDSTSLCSSRGDVTHYGNFKITNVSGGGTVTIDSLTASSSIQTDSSKNLISISNSGSGLNILQTSPTLITPIIGVATGTSLQLSSLTVSSSVQTDGAKNLITISNSGSGLNILQTSPTLISPIIGVATGTSLRLTALTASRLVMTNGSKDLESVSAGSNSQVLTLVSGTPTWTAPATSGTVTLVGLTSSSSLFTIGGTNPTTSSGTITFNTASTPTGTGTTLALANSPIFVTPDIDIAVGKKLSLFNAVVGVAFLGPPDAPTFPTSIFVRNHVDQTLEIGIAGGSGQFCSGALQGDAVIRSNKNLFLRGPTGAGEFAIKIDMSNNLTIKNCLVQSLTPLCAVQTDASSSLITIANNGSGLNILQTSPTLITPILGVAAGTSLTLSTSLSSFTEGFLKVINTSTTPRCSLSILSPNTISSSSTFMVLGKSTSTYGCSVISYTTDSVTAPTAAGTKTNISLYGGNEFSIDGTGSTITTGNSTTIGYVRAPSMISTSSLSISEQGLHTQWNRTSGIGESWIINQKGGGLGGIRFGESTTGNSVTETIRIDPGGHLVLNGHYLVLGNSGDFNHGLVYKSEFDGPRLFGNVGGALGTGGFSGSSTLLWNSTSVTVVSSSPSITIRTSSETDGAVYLGNNGHGILRSGNNVVTYTSSGNLIFKTNGSGGDDKLVLSDGAAVTVNRFRVNGINGGSSSSSHFYTNTGAIGDGNGGVNFGTFSYAGAQLQTFYNSVNSAIGNISVVGGSGGISTSFNTTSDYRLKKNIRPIKKAVSQLLKLKPCHYEWKDYNGEMDGFIAHELQEIVPYAVTGVKDGKEMQSVDYSKLTPLLVAAIQELYSLLGK